VLNNYSIIYNTASFTITKAYTSTTLVVPVDPIQAKTLVTIHYSVAVIAPGSGTPSGVVTVSDGTVNCSGTVAQGSCQLQPTTADVNTVTATYQGDSNFNGSTGTSDTYLVVYDPNAGFVTGGGWINSPAGAYAPNAALTGRANFGFVSKYQKGATVPTGETEFQFQVANLNFHSETYQWLVISGARAQYKGTGTINGAGNYGFLLTAIDGQINGGGGVDKFRIKIWDYNQSTDGSSGVVYDNQMGKSDTGSDSTELSGGSIVVHTK
jgi:hypothetical protein